MVAEKIDNFMAQLLSADPKSIPDLISSITESPGLFVFGEFLDHPKIKSLEVGPNAIHFDVLNLFCYGSFDTYLQSASKFPELKPGQIRKLKQLSIIDEAHKQKYIPYDLLFNKLMITSSRDLEDLVIELFYLEALTGKLDQQKALLEVDSAIGRDIKDQQISELHDKLGSWCNRVESILDHMAKEIKLANERLYNSEIHQKEVLEASLAMKEALRGQQGKNEVHSLRMDVDDGSLFQDILTDNRTDSMPHSANAAEGSGGERDLRSKIGLFKNLRHAKGSK